MKIGLALLVLTSLFSFTSRAEESNFEKVHALFFNAGLPTVADLGTNAVWYGTDVDQSGTSKDQVLAILTKNGDAVLGATSYAVSLPASGATTQAYLATAQAKVNSASHPYPSQTYTSLVSDMSTTSLVAQENWVKENGLYGSHITYIRKTTINGTPALVACTWYQAGGKSDVHDCSYYLKMEKI